MTRQDPPGRRGADPPGERIYHAATVFSTLRDGSTYDVHDDDDNADPELNLATTWMTMNMTMTKTTMV
jgi:hypothetical protein